MTCANNSGKIKAVLMVKNGMAKKALEKYLANDDAVNVQRQITKGVVKVVSVK